LFGLLERKKMTVSIRMFHPSRHLWIRATTTTTSAAASSGLSYHHRPLHRMLEIGLTERGLEDLGDITSIKKSITVNLGNNNSSNPIVSKGDELLQIHFEGHTITSADELYHTVWETYSDLLSVKSPVSGAVVDITHDHEDFDEGTVIVKMEVAEEEWQNACRNHLLPEPGYLNLLETLPRGKFADICVIEE
jgi:glycine cleavage system H lipoate-binding protein